MSSSVGLLAVGFLEHISGGIELPLLLASTAAIGVPALAIGIGYWGFRKLRRTSFRTAFCCGTGLSLTILGQWQYQREENTAVCRDMEGLETHPWRQPQPAPRPAIIAKTDRGSRVPLERVETQTRNYLNNEEERVLLQSAFRESIIRREPATDDSNCHGWVFTGGKYWVSGSAVDCILAENGYEIIVDPQPGDLVVYRRAGSPTHTAIVRYVTPGLPVLVEGKWSWMGVFLHPVDQSAYGTNHSYYWGMIM
jgi:hypothetical protein